MNLVKAQEYAASLPLAELKKYADGLNPSMIPPWLATGEMQAKTKRAEMANALQGAAQGQQASVKEQVEKKAGLMALQQAQQAQQQQMMQAVQPGGPVPENAPRPNPQPQPEAGLDQLPSNLQMAGGGIVAFTTGGEVDSAREAARQAQAQIRTYGLAQRKNDPEGYQAAQAALEKAQSALAAAEASYAQEMATSGANRPATSRQDVGGIKQLVAASAPEKEVILPYGQSKAINLMGNAPPAPPRSSAPPAPKPPAAPAVPTNVAPAPDSMDALFREALKNKPPERNVDSLIAEQQAIQKGLGLDEAAGKNKLERIADINKQYQATQQTPLQELISMFGQAGQSKGLSGLAPAYTNMEAQKRAADLAQAKSINELMGGVEDTQRAEKTATAGKVGTAREKDIENARLFGRDALTSTANTRGQDVQAGSSKYTADMHYKSAMAQLSNANARQNMQEKRLLLDAFKIELATIDRELGPLLKAPLGPAKDQIAELQARKAGLTRALDEASGIGKITGAPGAGSPGGNTRMRFDAKGNPI